MIKNLCVFACSDPIFDITLNVNDDKCLCTFECFWLRIFVYVYVLWFSKCQGQGSLKGFQGVPSKKGNHLFSLWFYLCIHK